MEIDKEEFHLLESLGQIDQELGLNASEIRRAMIHETKLYGASKALGFANWLRSYCPISILEKWEIRHHEALETEELYKLYLESL
jgi:hypothetical protein